MPVKVNHYMAGFFKKRELLNKIPQPRIILIGDSNVGFGFNSKELMDSLGMNVVNLGLQGGLGIRFIVNTAFPFCKSGDIVVFSIGYDHFFNHQDCGRELATLVNMEPELIAYLGDDELKGMMYNIPASLRLKVIGGLTALIIGEEKYASASVYRSDAFNEYGDVVKHWGAPNKDYYQLRNICKEWDEENFCFLIEQLKELERRSVKVILCPANIARTSYKNNDSGILLLNERLNQCGYGFIVHPAEMALDDRLFYDTPYHLTKEGVKQKDSVFIAAMKRHNVINNDF